jgi:hypothetical protein
LRGSQTSGERAPAAFRGPLKLESADLQYEVSLPFGTKHTLRIQGSQPEHVFLVHVSERFLSIARQRTKADPPGNIILATQRQRWKPETWGKLRIHIDGDQLAARLNGTIVRASDENLSGVKTAFALMVNGRAAKFRHLRVTSKEPPETP